MMTKGTKYPKKKKINGKMYTRIAVNPNFDIEDSYEHTMTLRSQGKAARVVRNLGTGYKDNHAVYVRDKK